MQIGSYTIQEELVADRSYRAIDATGNPILLKLLPADCLLEGQLNPNIAERLRHVREIAMTDVAHLRGVEREGDQVFIIWDYVDGRRLEEFLIDPARTAHDVLATARELIYVVERFHATGLVHGQLHGGNVLMLPTGRLKLIDVSPLLFVDPQRDEQAVVQLIQRIVEARGEHAHPLGVALGIAMNHASPMQQLSARLAAYEAGQPLLPPASSRLRIRRRTLLAALLAIIVGIGIVIGVTHRVRALHPEPAGPPRVAE